MTLGGALISNCLVEDHFILDAIPLHTRFVPNLVPATENGALPIVSPPEAETAPFHDPSRAWRELITRDWLQVQVDLRAQAIARFPTLGLTVFIFVYIEVSVDISTTLDNRGSYYRSLPLRIGSRRALCLSQSGDERGHLVSGR